MVRCLRGRGSGRGRGRGREGSAGLACGVRQQRVEGERASWQGGLWGWQWVGAAVVAEVGEEVEAVVAREWKQGLARGSGEGGGPVNWTWCCCYLHAALSTGAAELLSGRSSAYLRRIGVGAITRTSSGGLQIPSAQPLYIASLSTPLLMERKADKAELQAQMEKQMHVIFMSIRTIMMTY